MIRDPNNETDAEATAGAGNPTAENEAAAADNKLTSRLLPLSTSTSASSRSSTAVAPWMRLSKDPRIVRVSRAFGGKDRHSKVCTVRGLRDRRVRLSVPTAIQLYDLQDRLGLNQPSKVVDWLLDAAKDDIDQLPPLPMLPPAPGSYGGGGGGLMNHPHPHHHQSSTLLNSIASDQNRGFGSDIWRSSTNEEAANDGEDSEEDDRRRQGGDTAVVGHGGSSSSNNNNLLMTRSSTHPLLFPGLLNSSTNAMANYGFHNWDNYENHDHQSSSNYGFTSHPSTGLHHFNVAASSLPSTLSLSTAATTQSYFPSHDAAAEFMQSPHHQNLMANNSSGVYPNSRSSTMQRATPQNLLSMITKLGHQQQNKEHQEPPSR